MDISWEDAQTFLAVAEEHSFSAAARFLQLGQPTISRRIANLEQRLGKQLFQRGKQGARLTDDGTRLLPAAEQMARWAGEFGRLAGGADEAVAGVVRIAAPPGMAVEFMAPFAAFARDSLPEIRLEILAIVDHIDLSRGGADLAIRTREPREPELMTLHSITQQVAVFGSPEYAERLSGPAEPKDLDWVTWSFPYLHVDPRPQLERLIPNFSPAFASDNYLVQKRAVHEGLGVMIRETSTHPFARDPAMVKLETTLTLPSTQMHLVCAKSMRSVPRVRAVADLLIDQLQWLSDTE